MDFSDMKLPLADIAGESVVDGKGIRFTIFVQGCPHKCRGCHNPSTHPMEGGVQKSLLELAGMIKKNPLLDGVTFSGGEPFLYPKELAALSRWVHSSGMNVWCYSGYTLEELKDLAEQNKDAKDFLDEIDVLVDGRFVEEEKDLTLVFKGSKNQRIIDLRAARESK